MAKQGATNAAIARTFGCTRVTVFRLLQRLGQMGSTRDRPRRGRTRITTPAEKRHIRVIHLRNRFVTATSTASTALGHPISRHTVYRRLRHHGIRARRLYRGPYLTPENQRRQLTWVRQARRWQRRDWFRDLFTDESRLSLYRNDSRDRVYRRAGERLAPNCIQQVRAFGRGSVSWCGAGSAVI